MKIAKQAGLLTIRGKNVFQTVIWRHDCLCVPDMRKEIESEERILSHIVLIL